LQDLPQALLRAVYFGHWGEYIMTKLMGARRFTPGDRLFKLVEYLCIYMDMELWAFTSVREMPRRAPGNWFATLNGKQFPINIQHPVFGPFWAAFQQNEVAYYELTFVPATPKQNVTEISGPKWGEVATMFWNNALIYLYEQHRPWINCKYGSSSKDRNEWPSIFRFVWALRNAAAHHAGRLNLTDDVPPVTWHHLKFDHNNKDRVIDEVMSFADILVLMVEFSDELDALGCPKA
jgi:hypothetical protein